MNINSALINKTSLILELNTFIKKKEHDEQDFTGLVSIFQNHTPYFHKNDVPLLFQLLSKIKNIRKLKHLNKKIHVMIENLENIRINLTELPRCLTSLIAEKLDLADIGAWRQTNTKFHMITSSFFASKEALNSGDMNKLLSYLKNAGHTIHELDLVPFSVNNNHLESIIEYCPNLRHLYCHFDLLTQISFNCLRRAFLLRVSFVSIPL